MDSWEEQKTGDLWRSRRENILEAVGLDEQSGADFIRKVEHSVGMALFLRDEFFKKGGTGREKVKLSIAYAAKAAQNLAEALRKIPLCHAGSFFAPHASLPSLIRQADIIHGSTQAAAEAAEESLSGRGANRKFWKDDLALEIGEILIQHGVSLETYRPSENRSGGANIHPYWAVTKECFEYCGAGATDLRQSLKRALKMIKQTHRGE